MSLIQVELAEYKRSIYVDNDNWLIVTFKFPLLYFIWWKQFNLTEFVHDFKDKPMMLIVWNSDNVIANYQAVRLHWFDHNQPMRITYPDYSEPVIVIVLQIYTNDIENAVRKIKTNNCYIKFI